ncbi:hypothetical protein [Lichenifustis flavocetrariae]|uniref:Uncharacterized protein n=1 Tax=Lichenifustis flavocetrariae TaxID=2949735 RepID=A0AA42CRI6_9HYPH|nr:hypothetical protein [Lichenifustis flavocetrariae]MCW6512515.1 hypothetical protein [Lichenifustis flavocetrariae]
MSIKRMNAGEKARYFIGEAVMRQLAHAPRDPATRREIEAVFRWIDHWLTAEKLEHAMIHTGYVFDAELLDEIVGPPLPPVQDEDDQPF